MTLFGSFVNYALPSNSDEEFFFNEVVNELIALVLQQIKSQDAVFIHNEHHTTPTHQSLMPLLPQKGAY